MPLHILQFFVPDTSLFNGQTLNSVYRAFGLFLLCSVLVASKAHAQNVGEFRNSAINSPTTGVQRPVEGDKPTIDQSFDNVFNGEANLEELEDYAVDSMAIGHYDQALSALARLAVAGDEVHRYHLDRATIYVRLGNPRMAKLALEKALGPGSTLSESQREKAQELLALTTARASSPSQSTVTLGLGFMPVAKTDPTGLSGYANTNASRFAAIAQGRFRNNTSSVYPDYQEIQLKGTLGRSLSQNDDVADASFGVRFISSVATFKQTNFDTKWRNQFAVSSKWVAPNSPLREVGETIEIGLEASTGIEGPLGLDTRGSLDLFLAFRNFDIADKDRLNVGFRGTHQSRFSNDAQLLVSANLGIRSDQAVNPFQFFAGSNAQYIQSHQPILFDPKQWRARLEATAHVKHIGSFDIDIASPTTTLSVGMFERLEQVDGLQIGLGLEGFATIESDSKDNTAGIGLTFEMAYSF